METLKQSTKAHHLVESKDRIEPKCMSCNVCNGIAEWSLGMQQLNVSAVCLKGFLAEKAILFSYITNTNS